MNATEQVSPQDSKQGDTCSGCAFLRVFTDLKPHDLAPQGCIESRWAGYIHDMNAPPCGGHAFAPIHKSDEDQRP